MNKKALEKRNKIIEVVIGLAQRTDFKRMSIRNICTAANISIGTFYHYFSSKEDLLNAILFKIDPFLNESLVPILTEDESENLYLYIKAFTEDTVNNGRLRGGTVSNSFIPLPSTPKDIEIEHNRPLYKIPEDIIRRGQEKGQFSTAFSPEDLTDKLIMILRGCAVEWSRRNYVFDIVAYSDELARMFLAILSK